MTLNSCIAIVVFTTLCAIPRTSWSQDTHADANALYNQATADEHDGYTADEGGPGSEYLRECQRDCLAHAIQSYTLFQSKMAAWRIASCAFGAAQYVTAWLAFRAFDRLEPLGITGWTHRNIDVVDRDRVLRAYSEIEDHVGGVRLTGVEGPRLVTWLHGGNEISSPPAARAANIPELRNQLVAVDGVVYGVAESRYEMVVDSGGVERGWRIGPFAFASLSSHGIQEVSLAEPRVDESANSTPEPPSAPPMEESSAPVPITPQADTPDLTQAPHVALAPPAPPLVNQPSADGPSVLAPALTLGAGVAIALAGGGLWVMADRVRSDLDIGCPTRADCDPALRADADRGKSYTLLGNILAIGGGGVSLLGAIWLAVSAASGGEATSQVTPNTLALGIMPVAHGATVTVGGAL